MKEFEKQPKYKKLTFFVTYACVIGLFVAIRYVFGIETPLFLAAKEASQTDVVYDFEESYLEDSFEEELAVNTPKSNTEDETLYDAVPDSLLFDDSYHETSVNTPEDNLKIEDPSDETPQTPNPHRIRGVWSYSECFPDVQDVQIIAAQKYGIQPVRTREEAEVLVRKHKLVNICHSPFYKVDRLTHSIPYLVPRAQHLLNTISLNFIDSCKVKGLPVHLLMVTSVLRTTDDVSHLQKGNKNATTNSCHCYGTTVDIAYNRFVPVTGTYIPNAALLRWDEPMKQVLSEVLSDLRKQQKCYIKYEKKQGCFHLTCR